MIFLFVDTVSFAIPRRLHAHHDRGYPLPSRTVTCRRQGNLQPRSIADNSPRMAAFLFCARSRNGSSISAMLSARVPDARDQSRVIHTHADMVRARVFAIASGYEDCDDLDALRADPAFKMACGCLRQVKTSCPSRHCRVLKTRRPGVRLLAWRSG